MKKKNEYKYTEKAITDEGVVEKKDYIGIVVSVVSYLLVVVLAILGALALLA
ncbi:hypothetical protein SAMN05216249_10381 [Acetitomaculum ruminis DSM 5522]|uniref:Uncharacterized protein n=1 Tax=Acetitomaculum ruminis DSM 5522 TaxID=1120918 RepID=A0A1I0W4F8_9FIRM|nr:hypothetical protein [Acetitomaculum ruminis]SFA83639.1 hypothetical protein SAMN05216249_10381 [Acetitomaculum ruminis DSM 5522]